MFFRQRVLFSIRSNYNKFESMPRPLRFCHISTFYPPYSFGGDAVFIYYLANSLAAQGHEVDIIHCADSYRALAGKPTRDLLPHHPAVTVHTLRSPLGPLSPLLSQQTGRPWLKADKIRRILRDRKFDVVHFHNISLFGPKVLEMESDYGRHIRLYTTHEYWLVCPMHVLWKAKERLCDRPQCLRCALGFHRPPQCWRYTGLLERAVDYVDLFLSPSRFTIDMHHQRGFRKPITQLPLFTPAPLPETGAVSEDIRRRPYFLFVGRLERIKGLQNIIPIFRKYTQVDLIIAGKGSHEVELRSLAHGMGNVIFLGMLPSDRLGVLYRSAIALIVPSICYEVFPLVLFEAFSNRTPAIVNDLGALPEIVRECRGGLVCKKQEEFLSAMEQLQTHEELRKQLGHNAYRMWESEWSEQAHLRRYLNLLSDTAQRKYGSVLWNERNA